MKNYINALIVVEGKNDVSHLSSFIDSDFYITNGYDISNQDIEFLKQVSKTKPIIVLTDSDEAGKNIRSKLNETLPNLINKEVDISKCNNHHKHGIAECEIEEINRVLSEFFTKKRNTNIISTTNISELNIDKSKRDFLSNYFKLGECNNKTFVKRLNILELSLDDIKKALKQYGN